MLQIGEINVLVTYVKQVNLRYNQRYNLQLVPLISLELSFPRGVM